MQANAKEKPIHEPTIAPKRGFTVKTGLKVGQSGDSYQGCGCSPYDYTEGYNMGYNHALDNITDYLSQLHSTY